MHVFCLPEPSSPHTAAMPHSHTIVNSSILPVIAVFLQQQGQLWDTYQIMHDSLQHSKEIPFTLLYNSMYTEHCELDEANENAFCSTFLHYWSTLMISEIQQSAAGERERE